MQLDMVRYKNCFKSGDKSELFMHISMQMARSPCYLSPLKMSLLIVVIPYNGSGVINTESLVFPQVCRGASGCNTLKDKCLSDTGPDAEHFCSALYWISFSPFVFLSSFSSSGLLTQASEVLCHVCSINFNIFPLK